MAHEQEQVGGPAVWQTIDSAPKDGTPVVCCYRGFDGPIILKWFKYNGTHWWRDGDGEAHEPTHWVALPNEPFPE
jgi:hypothetical protein